MHTCGAAPDLAVSQVLVRAHLQLMYVVLLLLLCRRPGPPAAFVPTILGQVYQVINAQAVSTTVAGLATACAKAMWWRGCSPACRLVMHTFLADMLFVSKGFVGTVMFTG